jgi:hypothetical protein
VIENNWSRDYETQSLTALGVPHLHVVYAGSVSLLMEWEEALPSPATSQDGNRSRIYRPRRLFQRTLSLCQFEKHQFIKRVLSKPGNVRKQL